MLSNVLVTLAMAMPAAMGAALPQDFTTQEIVGGTVAAAGEYPFIVSLQSTSGSHFCGGTLVNGNTVVTAAHCSVGQSAGSVQIRAGTLTRNAGGTVARVSRIVVHPSYSASTYSNDVAVWKLSTTIPTSSTISYASLAASGSDPAAGSAASVAGWGTTSSGGSSLPVELRRVDVPIISRSACQSQYGTSAITSTMVCAGLNTGGKDSCQGDSGGPLVNASKQLIGIVSWGNGCALANYAGVYARVGALRTWIDSQL
jgi:trypsin